MAAATSNQSEDGACGAGRGYRFGTFKGVFTPSILTILGVVMYLRFGWVLGNAGLPMTLVIVTLATAITFLTGLSLSALATNMKVRGGGAYFIISRSLGVEAGAAVGLPLFFAQSLGIAFYVAGFSESMVGVFPELVPALAVRLGISEGGAAWAGAHAAQLVGVATLVVLTALACKSADLALKVQFLVMAAIAVSLVSFFAGGRPDLPPPAPEAVPAARPFWVVFAVFFPAVTGIEAGIAMSGDLKAPARSLPRGTIAAVLTGYVIYMAIPFFLSAVVAHKELLLTEGLIMRHVARWGGCIMAGIWAASLSSAMGALLGAPRTLQAMARDRIVSPLFGRGFGPGDDPRVATATAFAVALLGIAFGSLNLIAPVLSMFFLTSYGFLNISAGLEELTGAPSWRPKFRVPWGVCLAGAFGCFAVMFMINAGATFVAGFVGAAVYFLMERRRLRARWGDLRSGLLMLIARHAMHALARRAPDARTWKPNILVLSGSPTTRWNLIELANAMSLGRGFLTVASIMPRDTTAERVQSVTDTVAAYLRRRDVEAFVKVFPAPTALAGAQTLVRTYGYGPIAPNTVVLGETEQPENYREFAELIGLAHRQRQNLVLVRESEEVDPPEARERIDVWCGDIQKNLGLMLALVHLLRRGPDWTRAALKLKSVVFRPERREEILGALEGFVRTVRIDAQAQVLVEPSRKVFDTIRAGSRGADLVFLGMRAPHRDEGIESYTDYYRALLAQTEGLPPTALVLAAQDIDFYGIFAER